jgi:hypothetical protein
MKVNYLGGLTVSKVKLDERISCASALLTGSLALLEADGAVLHRFMCCSSLPCGLPLLRGYMT